MTTKVKAAGLDSDYLSLSGTTVPLNLPRGTTAQRPSSPEIGNFRFNTTLNTIEFWNGSAWLHTNKIPTLSSCVGDINIGSSGNLQLIVGNTTPQISVIYKVGGTEIARTNNVDVVGDSATTAIPAVVYGQSVGANVVISIASNDASASESSTAITKTTIGSASGGTESVSGGYKRHVFTSSGTLTVPNGVSKSAEYLCVAGGAGSGAYGNGGGGGGGGAGGMIVGSFTLNENLTVTVGAGGAQHAAGATSSIVQADGGGTIVTTTGGGPGGYGSNAAGSAGGSGGGGNPIGGGGGAGTSGQGNSGGTTGSLNQGDNGSSGGGGKGGAGGNASWTNNGAGGGAGLANDYSGSSVTYAAGGQGGNGTTWANNAVAGAANTGNGARGGSSGRAGAAGGSGIVIIRYAS